MCGMLFTNIQGVEADKFAKSLSLFSYRGPDNTSTLTISNNLLGHNRLSILDLHAASNQPMWSHTKKNVIIFNGEIYNFRELQKKYNITLTTGCDTELLLELYELLGEKMLHELNGMFAFVILNVETNSIFSARDRLGIKPLYMYGDYKGERLALSSEVSALKDLFGCDEIDEIGLRQYKKLRTFFNGNTLYKAIKMFPAGHYLKDGKLTKYWSLPYEPNKESPSDEELRYLVESAIQYRRVADVPVGSYLSGGLDSTIVAGLANEKYTWTVGFPSHNEFQWSELAAKQFGTTHTPVEVNKAHYLAAFEKLVETRQEPLSVPNEALLFLMTQKVKEKNKVVLSGEGADELFFGYDRVFRWANSVDHLDIKEFDQYYAYSDEPDDEIIESVVAPFKIDGYQPIDVVSHFFQVAHLHGLLRRLDNSTMMCSVEARVPFVDHRLVERMAGVSFDYKMLDGVVKAPLKRVFNDVVPKEIIERKKIGFPVPLQEIFDCEDAGKQLYEKWLELNLGVLGIKVTEEV